MREFDELLRKLSRAEEKAAAQELLESLFPAEVRAKYALTEAETGAEQIHMEDKAESYRAESEKMASRKYRDGKEDLSIPEMVEELSGSTERGFIDPAETVLRRGADYYEEDSSAAGEVLYRGEKVYPAAENSAREMSEFFRRDSRRYDREFQRY